MQVKRIAEYSAIFSTSIKLHVPLLIKIFVLSILSGRLRQGLLYIMSNLNPDETSPRISRWMEDNLDMFTLKAERIEERLKHSFHAQLN